METERAFTANADDQMVRTRLIDGMRSLGFRLDSENDSEVKFRCGSIFADEPSHRMYLTVRFDSDNHRHLVAVLRPVVWLGVFDWKGWLGVDEYYDSVLPLVEEIANGIGAQSVKSFLDLSKRVARKMIMVEGVICSFFIVWLMILPKYGAVSWANFYAALFLLILFLVRVGLDVYGYTKIMVFQSVI